MKFRTFTGREYFEFLAIGPRFGANVSSFVSGNGRRLERYAHRMWNLRNVSSFSPFYFPDKGLLPDGSNPWSGRYDGEKLETFLKFKIRCAYRSRRLPFPDTKLETFARNRGPMARNSKHSRPVKVRNLKIRNCRQKLRPIEPKLETVNKFGFSTKISEGRLESNTDPNQKLKKPLVSH